MTRLTTPFPWAIGVAIFVLQSTLPSAEPIPLAGTEALKAASDEERSAEFRAGIDRFLTRALDDSIAERAEFWNRDLSAPGAYGPSVAANRARFRRLIGVVDERIVFREVELVGTLTTPARIYDGEQFAIYVIRWPVLDGVWGEGLLLKSKRAEGALARVIALPDADQTPEMLAGIAAGIAPESQFARKLAAAGCDVIVPVLVDRRDNWSGSPDVWYTNQPHREWIYRLSYTFGRHIIGYEVQNVLALVDAWRSIPTSPGLAAAESSPICVAGYGEGGLLALYAAACDERIDAALVSGYFDSRQQIAAEPIYRNLFGLLREFGDAEIATLVYPRALVIEHSKVTTVEGPPAPQAGRRAVAAPGRMVTPGDASVAAEVQRVRQLLVGSQSAETFPQFITDSSAPVADFGSDAALKAMLELLKLRYAPKQEVTPARSVASAVDIDARQERQVRQLVGHTQRLLQKSPLVRASFWNKVRPAAAASWSSDVAFYREYFRDEIVGRYPASAVPPNARTRRIFQRPGWDCYEVLLDVYEDVAAWGWLAVPTGLGEEEQRPVVVCQHGLEGLPGDVFEEDKESAAYKTYRAYAARLADKGYVVFAPHNFYRGGNEFRQLQRKATPLKKTLFGFTVAQHVQLTNWLAGLPFVDERRIAFYGLSYGGSSASRLPPLVPRYSLVINSANFNEGIKKAASVDDNYSYVFHGTYEWFEWNAGNTFSDGDMAALIAPRSYMVERGHADGVAPDEWVASEYARVRRLYTQLGIPERTAIEFFVGGHVINGQETFSFLQRRFKWP